MNAREWKPGDVAAFTIHGGETIVGIRTSEGKWTAYAPGRDRSWINRPWDDMHGQRPLVVIDPEDREQVEALCWARWTSHDPYDVDKMQAALRSLITPPKPKEPLGLGAVVEDAKGKRWVRGRDSNCHWYPETGFDRTVGPWAPWAEIAAVKVLSPGVTA